MRINSAQGRNFFNSTKLVTVFVAAVLASEGTHYSTEHHNPHGNRRERIEELRQRTFEVNHDRSGQRSVRGGSSPAPQPAVAHITTIGRRRMFGANGDKQN